MDESAELFRGMNRNTGEAIWTSSWVDLILGSNSELCVLAEVYASDDAQEKFIKDFAAAWARVKDFDFYDLLP
jgi:catalase-peroxidase